jgi:lyso-ornithine lipid O-acyltransferase
MNASEPRAQNAESERAAALGTSLAGTARSVARATAMAAITAGMLQGVELHMRLAKTQPPDAPWNLWLEQWTRALLEIFGVSPLLANAPPAAAQRARLVVANHRSPLDILLLLRFFGGSVLSRSDLATWPVLGAAARKADTIFVDRASASSGVAAIRGIRERLAKGRTVILFPEGTTHVGDDVRPFLQGAFAATRGLDVDIVPVGLAYDPGAEFVDETFLQHMQRVAARPETRVGMAFGTPLLSNQPRAVLAAAAEDEVKRLVTVAREHWRRS